jgi:hypothetical protein
VYDSAAQKAHLGFLASIDFYVRNQVHGGRLLFEGENTATGALKPLIVADPDGSVDLYHAGIKTVETTPTGLRFYDGSDYAEIVSAGSDWKLVSRTHGHNIVFQGENTATGANKNIFIGSPDGSVELYYAGVKKFETVSDGVVVAGALKVDGNFSGETVANRGYFDFFDGAARITSKGPDGTTVGKFLVLQQTSDGSPAYITIQATTVGAVELSYAGALKVSTSVIGAFADTFVSSSYTAMGANSAGIPADDCWRIWPDGGDLIIQKRESGAWVTKDTISGA